MAKNKDCDPEIIRKMNMIIVWKGVADPILKAFNKMSIRNGIAARRRNRPR